MTDIIIKSWVETWAKIALYTPLSEQTLTRKYGKDMLAKGYVVKSKLGKKGQLTCWAYIDMIKKYVMFIQKEKGYF